jgi:hypothetical protein
MEVLDELEPPDLSQQFIWQSSAVKPGPALLQEVVGVPEFILAEYVGDAGDRQATNGDNYYLVQWAPSEKLDGRKKAPPPELTLEPASLVESQEAYH